MNWPPISVVHAASRNLPMFEVFEAEGGVHVIGLRSSCEWIVWVAQGAVCLRCKTAAGNPKPPGGQNDQPLFVPGTRAYALYLLATLLNPFYGDHKDCLRNEEATPDSNSPDPGLRVQDPAVCEGRDVPSERHDQHADSGVTAWADSYGDSPSYIGNVNADDDSDRCPYCNGDCPIGDCYAEPR